MTNALGINEGNYKWWGLSAMLFGTFTVTLSLSFLFPASPIIMRDFSVPIENVAWLSLAYALGASVFEPMWGRFGDLHGRKRNALTGLGLFNAGALVGAVTPNIWVMAGARFVQGFGAAAIIPIGMAFVRENFPETERGSAIGLWSMISGAAPAIAPTIGGYLIDGFGWRSIYWVSVLLGWLGMAAIALIVKESRRSRAEPLDLTGSALLALSVGSLLVAVNQGRSWGWTSIPTLGFAMSFSVFLVLLVVVESRTAHPVVDFSIVRTRLFISSATAVFISYLSFQGGFFLIPFFLEQVQGYPASQTGQLVMPLFLGISGASLVSGKLSDRIGMRLPTFFGTVLTTLALYLLTLVRPETSYPSLMAVMAILGIGIGASLPPISRGFLSGVPVRQVGAASGTFNMARNLGGPFGIAITATIFGQRAALVGKAYATVQMVRLGIDPGFLSQLPRLREFASSGTLSATEQQQFALLRDLGPKLQSIQAQARVQALQSAFTEAATIVFLISIVAILAGLLVQARKRPVT